MVLNILREGAKSGVSKVILSGFMVAAVGGLVMTDVGGFFRGGVGQNSVAKIAGQQLGALEFDADVKRILARQNLDRETAWATGMIGQILQSRVAETLIRRDTYELGLYVEDAHVAKEVSQLVAPYVSGDMTAREALGRILTNQGLSERQFTESLRSEMTANILRAGLQAGTAYTPDSEARDLYRYRNQELVLKIIDLPHKDITDYKDPTDEVLLPFYEAGKERYAIPETRRFSVAVLSAEDIRNTLAIDDDELKSEYEKQIDSFSEPERRTIEQAILKDRATADSVVEKVADGASLRDAVIKVTGNGQAYTGKDTVARAALEKNTADAVFSTDKGETAGPVETPAGFAVLTVAAILPAETKPFAAVKKELHDEILRDRVADQLYTVSGEIDDALAGGGSLEDVAKEYGLTIKTYGPIQADGSTPDSHDGLKEFADDRANVLQNVFAADEGESAPVLELKDGRFAIIRTDSIVEKSYKSFDSVKKDLASVWIQDQREGLNKLRAQKALAELETGGKTLDQIAKEFGAKMSTITAKRAGDPPAGLTPVAKTKFFETPKGSYAAATGKDSYVIGQVADVKLPDADKIAAKDLADIKTLSMRGTQDEVFLIYLDDLRRKYGVKVNDSLLTKLYGPGSETN